MKSGNCKAISRQLNLDENVYKTASVEKSVVEIGSNTKAIGKGSVVK